MKQLQAGMVLKSTEALNGSVFEGALIFIVEHNEKGALGFVVNKEDGRSLNGLEEFRHSPTVPLFDGGPVDKEHLFFIHQRADLVEAGVLVTEGIYYAGNFAQAVRYINNKSLTAEEIKIFIGYCGWDAGELETEIDEGSWTIEPFSKELIFSR